MPGDVRVAVEDFGTMRERTATAIADLELSPRDESNGEIAEFLRWMAVENFVFLALQHRVDGATKNSKRAI